MTNKAGESLMINHEEGDVYFTAHFNWRWVIEEAMKEYDAQVVMYIYYI